MQRKRQHPSTDPAEANPYAPPQSAPEPDSASDPDPLDKPTLPFVRTLVILCAAHLVAIAILFVMTLVKE